LAERQESSLDPESLQRRAGKFGMTRDTSTLGSRSIIDTKYQIQYTRYDSHAKIR